MTSEGATWAALAEDALQIEDPTRATVSALLAIRAELRTANLIALAGDRTLPLLHETWGAGTLPPEVAELRARIREELDLPDEEPRP